MHVFAPAMESNQQVVLVLPAKQAVLDLRRCHRHERMGVLLSRSAVRRSIQHTRQRSIGGKNRRGDTGEPAERWKVMSGAVDKHMAAHDGRGPQRIDSA